MRIVWTEPAPRDLAAARAWVAAHDKRAADRQVERVLTAVAGLLRFPEIGRPGRRTGTRELIISQTPYIAAYRVDVELIEILRVLHSRRRWPDTLT
ncbi:MAG: type II toxin-antitoxin system RelE/ParE family toxin [Acetobacteraceae bacterium]